MPEQATYAQRIGTLPVLPVHDVTAAIQWYIQTLGFTKLFDVPVPGGNIITGQVEKQAAHIMFNLNPADADKRGGGIYLWVQVEETDLDAFYADLKGKGVEIVDELQDGFWGDRYFSIVTSMVMCLPLTDQSETIKQ